MSNPTTEAQKPAPEARQAVPVNYEYSVNLPDLLTQLDLSLLISTYQAGRVASAVSVLPGYRNPAIIGPDTELDNAQSVWLVPSMA